MSPAAVLVGAPAHGAAVGQGFNLNASDLRFILQQIKISERHANTATPGNPCGTLVGPGPNQIPDQANNGEQLPFGLRTIDGSCNNLVSGRHRFGSADQVFPRKTTPFFMDAEANPFGPPGPNTSYKQKSGTVVDSHPRVVSNLIVDQTVGNPSAVEAADGAEPDANGTFFIPNTATDAGLSAPYSSLFTLFGQFFDHGLDLVKKGGGTVYMPLKADDPLIVGPDGEAGTADDPANPPPPHLRFMVLSRATNQPGPDGVMGTADDVQEAVNQTTPFVDQNQTYTSHPSHHVFLREYALNADGKPASTGRLINGAAGGMANWAELKAQAADLLGIALSDYDVLNVPLLATDQYGNFTAGPNGFPQLVTASGLVEGNPANPVATTNALRTGHEFLVDIAHHAVPRGDANPADGPGPIVNLQPDANPGTTDDRDPATYDDEMLATHFIAGDGRVNENIGLTAIHHVFHSEHNRLVGDIKRVLQEEDPTMVPQWQLASGDWNGNRLFHAAKFVTEMEYQHLAFEEFARKIQPAVNVFAGYDATIDSAIMAEFAHTVYRFGHSMLTESVDRVNSDGSRNDISLLDAFLNPPSFTDGGAAGQLTPDEAAGSVFNGMSMQVGNEIDEFVTDALRNNLLGLPLDLATINLARGRDTGVPPLNAARRAFFRASNSDAALRPYESWFDFSMELRHRSSLVNFVAAYGTHPTIDGSLKERRAAADLLVNGGVGAPGDRTAFLLSTGAWASGANGVTTTGLDDVDFWVGGLAEKPMPFGGLLGTTFNFVFETQMENLQDGDRFYYLERTAGLNLLAQLEGNSLAEMMMRNTTADDLPADAFSAPDLRFKLANIGSSGPILDDPTTPYDERALLFRMPDGTVGYDGDAHVIFAGTMGGDRIRSNEGDDTVHAKDGDDRVEGGSGNDQVFGGLGDDIITDMFGDDDIKGGDGNDAIHGGPGLDLLQPGRGNDFVYGGSDGTETFGGPGNDFIYGGGSADIVFGGGGEDWVEGGPQADLLQGDSGAPFQNDVDAAGNDVMIGGGGADDHDAEGGDDIIVAGPGIERNEGMNGYDWVTHKSDPQPANSDMNFTGLLPPGLDAFRDRFDLVEALSGWKYDDVLRGDSLLNADPVDPAEPVAPEFGDGDPADHMLEADGIALIDGLADLLPAGTTSFVEGNILLGGAGDDVIEGRGGNDIIDGDKWLDVQLRVPNLATANPSDTRLVDRMAEVQADVFAGRIKPGDISIERRIRTATANTNNDTAVFSDLRINYDCVVDGNPVNICPRNTNAGKIVVTHAGGTLTDGTDTLTNIEHLVFADSVPPGVPSIGTAAPRNQSVAVTFGAPTRGAVTGFEVEVLDAAENRAVPVLRIDDPEARSARVGGLTNGVAYRVRVRAFNAAGAGPWSTLSNEVIPAPVVPDTPSIASLEAGDGQVTVNFAAADDDGGSALRRFLVRVVNVRGNRVGPLRVAAATDSQLTVTGLQNGRQYWFSVIAVNGVGRSPASAEQEGTPGTVAMRPRIGEASSRTGAAVVRWTAPADDGGAPVTGYRILVVNRAGNQVGQIRSVNFTATWARVGRLRNGGGYRFRVAAVNEMGRGPWSALSNQVVPGNKPGQPRISRPSSGAPGGRLTAIARWREPRADAVPRITGYVVTAKLMASRAPDAEVLQQFKSRVLRPNRRQFRFVLPDGLYRFHVVAWSQRGRSEDSRSSRPVRAR